MSNIDKLIFELARFRSIIYILPNINENIISVLSNDDITLYLNYVEILNIIQRLIGLIYSNIKPVFYDEYIYEYLYNNIQILNSINNNINHNQLNNRIEIIYLNFNNISNIEFSIKNLLNFYIGILENLIELYYIVDAELHKLLKKNNIEYRI